MKTCIRSIAIVNVTLCILCLCMLLMGNSYLPGKLTAEMTSEVMLAKYELVCARLTASMTIMCLLAIVVIGIFLVRMYYLLKKDLSPAAGNED